MPGSPQQVDDTGTKFAKYFWIVIIGAATGFMISTRVLSPPHASAHQVEYATRFRIPDSYFSNEPIQADDETVLPTVELELPEPPFVSGLESVGLGTAFGAFVGFFLFLIATIRPISTSTADRLETRRVILSMLPLPLIFGFCGGAIGCVQWLWSATIGRSIATEYSPYIGVATGIITATVLALGVEKCIRARNKTKLRQPM